MIILKGFFFDTLQDYLIESHQILGTLLLNELLIEFYEIDTLLALTCKRL